MSMIRNSLQQSVNYVPWRVRGWIKHLPVIAILQRWFIAKFLAGEEFLHVVNAGPAKGLRYPISLPKDKNVWTGTYESDFTESLASAVVSGDICYDIGSYRGFFGGVFALAGAKLVIMFEPFPENCEHLKRLIDVNPQLPLKLKSVALSDRDGKAHFKVMSEASMGKITDSPFQKEVQGEKVINVPSRKLDSLIMNNEIPPPDVMKIDVEGAEVKVLEGAQDVLRLKKPKIFIEAHSHELAKECTSILNRFNYKVIVLETMAAPDSRNDPEVSHLMASPLN